MPLPAQEDVGSDLLGAGLVVDDAADDACQPGVVGAEQFVEPIAGEGRRAGQAGRVQCVHEARTREVRRS